MSAAKIAIDADSEHALPAKGEWPLWKLSLVALPMMTVGVFWTFLGPNSAPFLLRLGMSPSMATLNNMAGPITGFFTAPIVGAMSDSLNSPYGRRRPIILAGLVLTWVAGVLFASSEYILPEGAAMFLAAPMYWMLDVTINILQTPFRALVSDIASEEQQVPMQVIILCYQSLGYFFSFSIMKLYDVAAEHMLELIVLISVLNTLAIVVQFSVAEERQLQPDLDFKRDAECSACSPLVSAIKAAKGSPSLAWQLAAIQSMLSVGGTAWALYAGQWFGICVFQGDPSSPLGSAAREAYVAGQAEFADAGQSKGITMLLASLCIMFALGKTGVRPMSIYAACIFVGACATLSAAFLVGHSHSRALISSIFSVIPFAAQNSIPFGLLAKLNKRAECEGKPASTALQMSLLNCASTVGQQTCTTLLAAIEGRLELARALPLMFMIAGSSELFAGLGALLVDYGMHDERSDMVDMSQEMLSKYDALPDPNCHSGSAEDSGRDMVA